MVRESNESTQCRCETEKEQKLRNRKNPAMNKKFSRNLLFHSSLVRSSPSRKTILDRHLLSNFAGTFPLAESLAGISPHRIGKQHTARNSNFFAAHDHSSSTRPRRRSRHGPSFYHRLPSRLQSETELSWEKEPTVDEGKNRLYTVKEKEEGEEKNF